MCQKVHTVERDNPQHAKRITWAVQEQKAAATEYLVYTEHLIAMESSVRDALHVIGHFLT